MIRAVHEHHNRFYYSQVTVQYERVDHNNANTLLLLFNSRYCRSDKTTEPELSNPGTFFEPRF
jgi:hypothetical protein